VRNFFVALCIAAALSRGSYAQLANTTSLVGTVTDSAGAAVAAASITAVNTATNDTYNASTNSSGDYAIEFIKIGTYNVTAKQAGFEVLTKNGITVNYNQTGRRPERSGKLRTAVHGDFTPPRAGWLVAIRRGSL
jgi:hypothetical protein